MVRALARPSARPNAAGDSALWRFSGEPAAPMLKLCGSTSRTRRPSQASCRPRAPPLQLSHAGNSRGDAPGAHTPCANVSDAHGEGEAVRAGAQVGDSRRRRAYA